jgi:hypothetical protein
MRKSNKELVSHRCTQHCRRRQAAHPPGGWDGRAFVTFPLSLLAASPAAKSALSAEEQSPAETCDESSGADLPE